MDFPDLSVAQFEALMARLPPGVPKWVVFKRDTCPHCQATLHAMDAVAFPEVMAVITVDAMDRSGAALEAPWLGRMLADVDTRGVPTTYVIQDGALHPHFGRMDARRISSILAGESRAPE